MSKKTSQGGLALGGGSEDGPVECLGEKFESDAARWEHYQGLLREKLKDPDFRNQPGFPLGKDEDILALSDPPFYTACPNPWVADFVKLYGTSCDPKDRYHREPFAADISEGKNHPLYKAHAYHTKVPHRAIMQYILHYTEPGDLIYDGFCGTGMTGVAAQMCAKRSEVCELNFQVTQEGSIVNSAGETVSRLGARRAIINDICPYASFIAYNYNTPLDVEEFYAAARAILDKLHDEIGWMYETNHSDGTVCPIDFTVWSEVYTCAECGGELAFTEEALDRETNRIRDEFPCPHCSAQLSKKKKSLERVFETRADPRLGGIWRLVRFSPCLIQYRHNGKKCEKRPDKDDLERLERIERIERMPWPTAVPNNEWPIDQMYHGSRIAPKGFTHSHHFFLSRAAQSLGRLWDGAASHESPRVRQFLRFFVEQAIWGLSRMNRFSPSHFSQVNRMLTGVYYVAAQHSECSPWYNLDGKLSRLVKAFSSRFQLPGHVISFAGSSTKSAIPDSSIDYIFTDPPFGENIFYSDLNLLVESWYGVLTNSNKEAIVDKKKKKGLHEYKQLMLKVFAEYFRILKPGRWITVEFSNSKAAIWNSIQTTLQEAGFVVANVAALDKQQRSFRSVTSPTAVKQDLVISAYKPNGQLELNFARNSGTPQGVWDFIEYHLRKLPVVKIRGGQLEPITERDPRILFDRTVAFFVTHETPVPISSAEFQKELDDRYAEREGMIYLADQVAEYDSAHAKLESVGQMAIFVEDEKSAINWLRNFLKKRPSTYQDVQPDFMQQLNASWKKWEDKSKLADLEFLLSQTFLQYKGEGPVPSQIHSHLSTDFKDLRKLDKEDPMLKEKAMDRWYVPDPSKQKDMDELRERRLVEEFWSYLPPNYVPPALSASTGGDDLPGLKFKIPKISKGKKMKELRTEAIRAGFRFCYQKKDYQTMLVAAQIIPDAVIEEDEQLQLLYDTAVTRSGVED